MKVYFNLKVPVKHYLKKYIIYQYRGYTRLVITKDNIIGRKVFDLLSISKNIRYHGQDMRERFLSFTILTDVLMQRMNATSFGRGTLKIDEITFNISANYTNYRCGVWLTKKAVVDFNEHVDVMFRKDFHEYMDDHRGSKSDNQLMCDFMEKYKMTEEDLTLDMLKKDYQRYLKTLRTPINRAS